MLHSCAHVYLHANKNLLKSGHGSCFDCKSSCFQSRDEDFTVVNHLVNMTIIYNLKDIMIWSTLQYCTYKQAFMLWKYATSSRQVTVYSYKLITLPQICSKMLPDFTCTLSHTTVDQFLIRYFVLKSCNVISHIQLSWYKPFNNGSWY